MELVVLFTMLKRLHSDPDGQPSLDTIPQAESIVWRRPAIALSRPLRILDPTLSAEDIVQTVVTDCSVVAAISICIQHDKKYASKVNILHLCNNESICFNIHS